MPRSRNHTTHARYGTAAFYKAASSRVAWTDRHRFPVTGQFGYNLHATSPSNVKLPALVIVAAMYPLAAVGQPVTIDFARDVLPIFREHCVSCHGPEMQMNGLRLDRRADALRGGTQSDIGPGNAEGSRLYHRLIGTVFGTRMPPGEPLSARDIETIREWIDRGAVWPDDVSGDRASAPPDTDATRLNDSIRGAAQSAIDDVLRATPRAATRRGPAGTTPLMSAALYGDAALVKRLLAAGADPNTTNTAGATALMWAVPDVGKMQTLLDAGADVDARSDEGRSALTIASGIVGAAPGVRLLLEYGADPVTAHAGQAPPLREAARVGDSDIFRLLMEYGARASGGLSAEFLRTTCFACAEMAGLSAGGPLPRRPPESNAASTAPTYDPGRAARPTPLGPTPATAEAIRAAIARSLPLLQGVGNDFVQETGCASCHHNSLVSMAVATARASGYAVDEAAARQQASTMGRYLESWRERTLQNIPIAGGVDTISYLLFGMAADRYPSDGATDAQALWLLRHQAADGHWPVQTLRPPIESNDIEATALSMRALQVFAPPSRRTSLAEAIDRARAWLMVAPAVATEERAFRLLGLSWAGAPAAALRIAARDLLAGQRGDGGWSQTDGMGSDAYATGEALVALRQSAMASLEDRAYRRGLEYLLRTQIDDGSWMVESRSVPIQAYFESGFPYGTNQWISAAATAWATTALALSQPVTGAR
jgi:hypothetical protein